MAERLDRIEQGIEGLNQSLNFLVTEFIRPNAQQAHANYERLERIEENLEGLTAKTVDNADSIAGTAQQIAELKKVVEANSQSISRLERKVDDIAETVKGQSLQVQTLVDEGRADRQAQREALAAILSNASRIDVLERQAS